jgi:hypothetical protein
MPQDEFNTYVDGISRWADLHLAYLQADTYRRIGRAVPETIRQRLIQVPGIPSNMEAVRRQLALTLQTFAEQMGAASAEWDIRDRVIVLRDAVGNVIRTIAGTPRAATPFFGVSHRGLGSIPRPEL